jgi:hypothetical protein
MDREKKRAGRERMRVRASWRKKAVGEKMRVRGGQIENVGDLVRESKNRERKKAGEGDNNS